MTKCPDARVETLRGKHDTVYVVRQNDQEIWMTPTCVRNTPEVLDLWISDPPEGIREWVRDSLVVAIDWFPERGPHQDTVREDCRPLCKKFNGCP